MTVIAFATDDDAGGCTSDDHQLVRALRARGVAVARVAGISVLIPSTA